MCLGIPGQVMAIREDRALPVAVVDFGGVTKDVCLAYVPEASVGEFVIVHAGFAIALVDEDLAGETLAMFGAMGGDDGPNAVDGPPSRGGGS